MCYHNYAHVSLVCFSSGLQSFSQEFTFWGFFPPFIPRYHDIKKVEFPSDMDLSFPLFFFHENEWFISRFLEFFWKKKIKKGKLSSTE